MALTSPGVEVTIIDQSQYLPAPSGTIPLVVLATAQNKASATGVGVAQGTTAANANKLFQVTSQRDLVTLYGNPFFYTTANGTPIQGYELNEYGLLAAYSVLGVTNRIYVLRSDIDLAALVGQTGRPTGAADDGDYWLNTTTSDWGIYQWNSTTQKFEEQTPLVIVDSVNLSGNAPLQSLGSIGSYAVVAIPITTAPSKTSAQQYFYKNSSNNWVVLGSQDWLGSWPTILGTTSNPTPTAGTFTINVNGGASITITISGGNSVYNVASSINAAGLTEITASVISGKLAIFGKNIKTDNLSYLNITSATTGLLASLGITSGSYYQPLTTYGTAAEMPLWSSSQQYPRPNGSVWVKVGAAGNGLNLDVSQYSTATGRWNSKTMNYAIDNVQAIYDLDPTGGKAIPAGTLYTQYSGGGIDYYQKFGSSPNFIRERSQTGPTIVTGTVQNPSFTAGPYYLNVFASTPNSTNIDTLYTVIVPDDGDATDFVTAWSAAQIPYTTASVSDDDEIILTHTEGGEIYLSDYNFPAVTVGSISTTNLVVTEITSGLIRIGSTVVAPGVTLGTTILSQSSGVTGGPGTYVLSASATVSAGTTITCNPVGFGTSNNLLVTAGFTDATDNVNILTYNNLFFTSATTSSGSGSGCQLQVRSQAGFYIINGIYAAGSGYVVGEILTISGINLGGLAPTNNLTVEVTNVSAGAVTQVSLVSGTGVLFPILGLSNWVDLDYTPNEGAPVNAPANNTNWFYSVVDQVDIMVNTSTGWKGYKNVEYDSSGFPTAGGSFNTDPNGPMISPTQPTTQSDGTALVYGDLWVDTSDLELYPLISRWQSVDGEDKWVLIDNTDQVSSTGILFADARWATNGTTNPANDPIPTIVSLLTSNYLDLDAPNDALYPVGMLLWNTRRSGYNVKQYKVNYFNATDFPDETLPTETDAWVSASGLQSNGAPYMGRKAQRNMVVMSLRSAIDTNTDIRDEDNAFNLIATPNYPELQPNMVVLNADRGETGYILGDTPMGLSDSATAIQAWATNAAGATSTGEEGCVTRNTYLGLFYPSGLASDLGGNLVAVPASHMMLRTFVRNDTIAYPWLAAAGTRRGTIDNATNIGYLNRTTGEFTVIKTRLGVRDVLYTNFINPLVFFTGNGLLNYGNKTSFDSQSALDRTNVARLVAYIRRQLTVAARPFVFEPNDALTRQQIAGVVESLMIDLVAKRGIYDYIVVCDESNNTPSRIDRNELWVDVAIEPVKAAEFIYIPVRILNTGELSAA